MTPQLETLVFRALGALGNGVFQGLVVAVGVLLALRILRRTSAATRYAVAFVGLVIVAALPLVHFLLPHGRGAAKPTVSAISPETRDSSVMFPTVETSIFEGDVEFDADTAVAADVSRRHLREWNRHEAGSETAEYPGDMEERRLPSSALESSVRVFPEPFVPDPSSRNSPVPDLESHQLPATSPAESAFTGQRIGIEKDGDSLETGRPPVAVRDSSGLRFGMPTRHAVGLLGFWASLVLVRLVLLGRQCLILRRWKRTRLPVPESIEASFRRCLTDSGVRRVVLIGSSPGLPSPVAVGYFRPAVLLPSSITEAPPEEIESVIRHELAHVRRHDDWTNLVQQIVRAVFFFHPGVEALSRSLALDREIACDDHVLERTPNPKRYALFLTDFAGRVRGRSFAAAPAAWSNPNQLRERIHMILDPHRNASPRVAPTRAGLLTLAALLVAAAGIGAAPRLSLAPDATPAESAETTVEWVQGPVEAVPRPARPVLARAIAAGDGSATTLALAAEISSDETPKPKIKSGAGSAASAASAHHARHDHGPATVTVVDAGKGASVAIASPPTPAQPSQPVPPRQPLPAPTPVPVAASSVSPHGVPSPAPSVSQSKSYSSSATAKSDSARSLEERIRRLEKLVEKLGKVPKPGESIDLDLEFDHPGHSPHGPDTFKDPLFRVDGLTRELEGVSKTVERALRDAERTARESLRSAAQARNRAQRAQVHQEVEVRRNVLQSQREALERQVEALQHDIDHLENELERLGDAMDEAADAETEAREEARDEKRESDQDLAGEARTEGEANDFVRREIEVKRRSKEAKAPAKVKARASDESVLPPSKPPTIPNPPAR